jgi:hypothetical protein
MLGAQIAARTLAPSEARAQDNRLPFTEEQLRRVRSAVPEGRARPPEHRPRQERCHDAMTDGLIERAAAAARRRGRSRPAA